MVNDKYDESLFDKTIINYHDDNYRDDNYDDELIPLDEKPTKVKENETKSIAA